MSNQVNSTNRVAVRSLLVNAGHPAADVRTWTLDRLESELAAAVSIGKLTQEQTDAALAKGPFVAAPPVDTVVHHHVVTTAAPKAQPKKDAADVQTAVADALGKALGPIFANLSKPSLDIETVRETIRDEIAKQVPRRIEVKVGETVRAISGRTHAAFEKVLKAVSAGLHVWLVGPSGSGKSHMVSQVAEALARPFFSTGAISTKHELIGYVPPNTTDGKALRTPFRDAFENGGVFSWDDVDGSDPRALVAFNEALANGRFAFPDGMVNAHPDFVAVASANTWGTGANADYVGRAKIDAATLTRFVRIWVDYDELLERDLAGADGRQWCDFVQRVRKAVSSLGVKILVTPRQTLQGVRLLAAGMERTDVEKMTVFAGLDSATEAKIRAAA